jgi:DNA-binding CsgD family transcriptional regulator
MEADRGARAELPGRALLERARELAAIETAVLSAPEGEGRLVVLEGQAGIGKSALVRAARASAEAAGMTVLAARGGELERSLSFGVVRQLLEAPLRSASEAERDELLAGPAAAARPLFERGGEQPTAGDDLELLHGLYWLCANLAERAPLLLTVDDVHWSDAPSLRFLVYLAPRLETLPVTVAATVRPSDAGDDELVARLAGHSAATCLRIPPLSAEAVERLVRERFPGTGDVFCAACARVSGGNPHLVRELLAAMAADGRIPDEATADEVSELAPDSVLRSVLARLARLPSSATSLARAVAVLGDGAELRHAAALADLDVAEAARAADALAAAEILAPGQPLGYLHPLLRSAVYADAPPLERGMLHRTAAQILADDVAPERVATHLLAAPATSDPWAVDILRAAARQARATASPDAAARYLARAFDEPPPRSQWAAVLVELGEAEAAAGVGTALARLEEALRLVDDPRARAETMLRLGWMLHKSGRLGEAADIFERGLGEVAADDPLRLQLEVGYLGVAWYDSRRAADVRARRRALLSSPGETPARAERGLVAQQVLHELSVGDSHEEVRALARRLLGDGALLADEGADSLNVWIAVGALTWSDDFATAEGAIEAALEETARRGEYLTSALALYTRAWPRYWSGRIAEALADAQAAVSAWRGAWAMYLPGAMYWVARAHIERDELDEAAAALDLPEAEERWGGTTMYAAWRAARGRVALARGRAEEALAEQLASGALLRDTLHLRNPAIGEWRSEAALAAARLGDDARARELVEEELGLARAFGAARPVGVALRAAGLVTGGKEGAQLLREAVEVLEASPARLELARALVELGAVLRRAGSRAEARDPLRRGLQLVERFGAFRLERQAREELAATGAHLGRRSFSGRDALTPSERRVAEMAAAGMSNREIAQSLFVTVNAVKWHLRNAYRKLDIATREELADALEARAAVVG